MELHQWQESIKQFAAEQELSDQIPPRLLDLASELGELSKAYLLATEYGSRPFTPQAAWVEEIGDLLFSLLLLASISQTSAENALRQVIEKYEQRLHERGSLDSGNQARHRL